MRESAATKADRLLTCGRLTVEWLDASTIRATCRGDSGENYRAGYDPDAGWHSRVLSVGWRARSESRRPVPVGGEAVRQSSTLTISDGGVGVSNGDLRSFGFRPAQTQRVGVPRQLPQPRLSGCASPPEGG